jgi:PiT family inorganic phosphate transporter
MGMKLTKLKPVHGFCAETAGAFTIFFATKMGIPISTTHTIAGSIVGVGMTKNFAGIKWIIAYRIVIAWILTIPASAAISAICFLTIKLISSSF